MPCAQDASESRKREGIGLGLAVVKEIARLHQAEVSVESARGAGSTFRVRFPVAATAKASEAKPRHKVRALR